MILNNVRRLISFGIKATRLDQKQTKAELKKLAAAGIVEAKHASRIAKAVLSETNRERKIITAFMLKEMEKELKKAAPHAKRAAARARGLGRKAILAAKRVRSAPSKRRTSRTIRKKRR